MNMDRGMIKWQPFNSVVNNKELINSLMKEKAKVKPPAKSEEEINALEEKIIDAYFMQEKINITYYQNGFIKKVSGTIKKIDHVYKMIYLENQRLLFHQIITIEG